MNIIKILVKVPLIIAFITAPNISSAKNTFDFASMLKSLASLYNINLEQLDTSKQQGNMMQKQNDLSEKQLKTLEDFNKAITGKYGFGKLEQSSTKAWLNDSQNLEDLLNSYLKSGSQFGRLAQQHEKQFPIKILNSSNSSLGSTDKDYYNLSARTVLSTRTASEYEFNNIDYKLASQEALIQKIDTTNNVKAALDLLARLQGEGNKIMLENLRMMSIHTQQTAIDSQGQINSIAKSAKFLSTEN